MRILLKHNETYAKTYWIKRSKTAIIGWFGGTEYVDSFGLESTIDPDIHFTYPKDGNYHISLKYQKKIEEHYVNAYKGLFKIKTIDRNTRKANTIETSRTEYPNKLSHFVPTFHKPALDVYGRESNIFQFPSKGFAVYENFKLIKVHGVNFSGRVKKDDLVIDINKYENQGVTISICAVLLGKGQKLNKVLKDYNCICDFNEYPHICMGYRAYKK